MADDHPRHIIAAGALVSNKSGEILLVLNPERGWEIPGGQVEIGESLHQAVRREILEESGIHANIGPLAGIYSRLSSPQMVLFMFLGGYESGEPTPSAESLNTEWVPRDKVLERITHPVIRNRISDLLAFQGRILYRVYSTYPYTIHEELYLNDLHEWGLEG
jgi:8-oxo-dGTP diphosphatase